MLMVWRVRAGAKKTGEPYRSLPDVAEFQFRYNNRENADILGTALNGC